MKSELKTTLQRLNILGKVEELGLDSAPDILSKTAADLQRLLGITNIQAFVVLKAASKEAYQWKERGTTADELIKNPQILTTGDATIDKILNGGILLGAITEVVGESSSGKTQLGLQLCLTAQKPKSEGGLEGAAVYIHSEGPFPSVRLDQLVHNSYPEELHSHIKSKIHTIRIKTSEEQFRVLAYQLPGFLENHPDVRVVVIDSISAIYRGESTPAQKRFEKMSEICELGTRLKKIAHKYNVAVVAINQVSDVPTSESNQNNERIESWMDFKLINNNESNRSIGLYIQSLTKIPVLGLAWSNSVNTRIRLARSPMLERLSTRRVLFVEFSPVAARIGCELAIDDYGIHAASGYNE